MSNGKNSRNRTNRKGSVKHKPPDVGLLETQQQREEPNQTDTTRNEPAQHEKEPPPPMRFHKRLQGLWSKCSLTDRIIAVFTVVLAAASIYQFTIMDRQLDTMRKDQRAWVVVTQKSDALIAANAPLATNMSITNSGKTPAMRVVGYFYIEVVPNGGNPHFEAQIAHSGMSDGLIMPSAYREVTVVRRQGKTLADTMDAPLTEIEKSSLDSGTSWIARHGIVYYDDVFKVRHWTKYCFWSALKTSRYSAFACTAYNSVGDN